MHTLTLTYLDGRTLAPLLNKFCQLPGRDSRVIENAIEDAHHLPRIFAVDYMQPGGGRVGHKHLLPRCRRVACFPPEGIVGEGLAASGGSVIVPEEMVHERVPDRVLTLMPVAARFDFEKKLLLNQRRSSDSRLPSLVDSLPKEQISWRGIFQDHFEQLVDAEGCSGWEHGFLFEGCLAR